MIENNDKRYCNSGFPVLHDNFTRVCDSCTEKVVNARKKYVKDFFDSGEFIPENGCAYCGQNSFTRYWSSEIGGLGESKWGEFCSEGCARSNCNQQFVLWEIQQKS